MKIKYCVIEIKGGFGNQLFQYSFANYLKKLGYIVRVKNTFYKDLKVNQNLTFREEILDSKIFDINKISYLEIKVLNFLNKINTSNKFNKIFPNFVNNFFEYYKDNDISENQQFALISHFDGYWQDINYLDIDFIKKSLSKIKEINQRMNFAANDDSFMLLVRRGDYINMGQDLNLIYYKKCFEIIYNINKNPIINIFTDDVDWVKKNKLFNKVTNIYGPEDSPKRVLELFCKMINHTHFFVGNSTFSYFAAILGKKDTSKIFVADPWFRNRPTKNLKLDGWETISND